MFLEYFKHVRFVFLPYFFLTVFIFLEVIREVTSAKVPPASKSIELCVELSSKDLPRPISSAATVARTECSPWYFLNENLAPWKHSINKTYLEEIGGHDHQVQEQKDALLGLALPVLFQKLDIGSLQNKVEASQQLSLLVRHSR